jgi:hypothetical protein
MAAGSDQNLNIVVRLKDEASKNFDTLKGKLDGMQKSMTPATDASKKLALGFAAVGTAAIGFGTMAVKSAMEAEVQMAKFDAKMKTVKGGTEEARKAILDRANAVVKMGFDDEAAANNMANLFQRTGDVNKAMELNNLAMDLARDKNISLTDAGNMVGMVMSGNARALKQYGIEIDDSLTPMQALEQLQGKVTGQADAYTKTLQGQKDVLSNTWDNFLQVVGEKLLPVLTTLLQDHIVPFVTDTLPKWIEKMQEINKWLNEHQSVLLIVAGAIAGALAPAILFSLIPAIWGMVTAFAAASLALAPWIIGGALIAGIVAGAIWIYKNWDTVKEQLSRIWNTIKDTASSVWNSIASMFKGVINGIIGTVEGWANGVVSAVNTIIDALNKIQVKVPSWVPEIGGKSFGINIQRANKVSIPRMEHGGTIMAPRGTEVPIIAHGGEQIIPAGSQSGGSVFIQVTINNPRVESRDDANRLQEQIDRAMRDLMRNHKLQSI